MFTRNTATSCIRKERKNWGYLEEKATQVMRGLYPGNYRVEEHTVNNLSQFHLVFDDSKDELIFILRYK
jgi:hypothetical protein